MSAIVAHCPGCGLIFKSRLIGFGPNANGGRFVLHSNSEQCPRCGRMAAVVDGVFTAAMGQVRLLAGPQITQEILKRFTELVEQARRNEISPDALQELATKLDPKLGEAVAEARKFPFWLAMLLLTLTTIKSCNVQHNFNHTIDWNRALEQVIEFKQKQPVQKPAPTRVEE